MNKQDYNKRSNFVGFMSAAGFFVLSAFAVPEIWAVLLVLAVVMLVIGFRFYWG